MISVGIKNTKTNCKRQYGCVTSTTRQEAFKLTLSHQRPSQRFSVYTPHSRDHPNY